MSGAYSEPGFKSFSSYRIRRHHAIEEWPYAKSAGKLTEKIPFPILVLTQTDETFARLTFIALLGWRLPIQDKAEQCCRVVESGSGAEKVNSSR